MRILSTTEIYCSEVDRSPYTSKQSATIPEANLWYGTMRSTVKSCVFQRLAICCLAVAINENSRTLHRIMTYSSLWNNGSKSGGYCNMADQSGSKSSSWSSTERRRQQPAGKSVEKCRFHAIRFRNKKPKLDVRSTGIFNIVTFEWLCQILRILFNYNVWYYIKSKAFLKGYHTLAPKYIK